MSFPCKSEREKCWNSRDVLWKCLDENPDKPELCAKFREAYVSICPGQWVKHFDRKREYLKFKDQIQNDGGNRSDKERMVKASGATDGDSMKLGSHQNQNQLTVPSLAVAVSVDGTSNSSDADDDTLRNLNTKVKTRVVRKFQPWSFT